MPFFHTLHKQNFLRCKASNNKAEALLTHSYGEINAGASSRLYFNVLHTCSANRPTTTGVKCQHTHNQCAAQEVTRPTRSIKVGVIMCSNNLCAAADYLKVLHSCHKTPTLAEGLLINSSPSGPLASITVASAQNSQRHCITRMQRSDTQGPGLKFRSTWDEGETTAVLRSCPCSIYRDSQECI